ncbi:MAG: ABC transporter ATP-binding protein [Chloroflexi bacterium]|nr:ABC transporter ATP-binding protein [Chloroflexota bacterium]
MTMLQVEHISKRFGGLQALENVSLQTEGEILGLIGPNGAGKTTLFNIISGFLPPTSGTVRYDGQALHKQRPHQIVRLGIARTFQIVKPFGDLSVQENVLSGIGMPVYPHARALFQRYRTPVTLEQAEAILTRTDLQDWAQAPAANLPIGLQRRLEIARALATHPRLLLLDEPAAGLTSHEADDLAQLIRSLHEEGIDIIVIEHNMSFAMNLCERIVVLAQGQIIASGTPSVIQQDERVINAYLGQEEADVAHS